ncbi:MAG: DUF362 domain-containing protein [Candidatus Electrothrix sp. YB6]
MSGNGPEHQKTDHAPGTRSGVTVALTACSDYEPPVLFRALEQVLQVTELPVSLYNAKVLLKPNLVSAKSGPLSRTEGALILAVAQWFLDHGAQLSIGDSPAFGTASVVLKKLNLTDELTVLGVQVQDFTRAVQVDLPGGAHAMLARTALECDLLVNLPRVKAHAQTRLTLAVKNLFGCLVGLRKAWWHMVHGGGRHSTEKGAGFFDRIVCIPAVLPPCLSIVDGIVAMHKTGPVHGSPYPLATLAASINPVAADRALHEILGVQPEHSPVMAACQRAALPGAELLQLAFPLSAPEELRVHDFQVLDELHPVRFNPFQFLKSSIQRAFMHTFR